MLRHFDRNFTVQGQEFPHILTGTKFCYDDPRNVSDYVLRIFKFMSTAACMLQVTQPAYLGILIIVVCSIYNATAPLRQRLMSLQFRHS